MANLSFLFNRVGEFRDFLSLIRQYNLPTNE